MNTNSILKYLETVPRMDLYEIQEHVNRLIEKKNNENRVTLLRVSDEGMEIAYFREDEMEDALTYCLENLEHFDFGVKIEQVKIIESEVESRLESRWY